MNTNQGGASDGEQKTEELGAFPPATGSVSEPSAKLWAAMQLKADMFDYLCWLEDFCQFRQAALDGNAGDYLVLASDGTACWAKTYAEAVRVAMEHDKELHDATTSQNNQARNAPQSGE